MNYFWLDANAIVKQYVTETGTSLINHIFTRVPLNRMFCLFDSMDETRHVFVRKKNGGIITIREFNRAIRRFEIEFIRRADVKQVNPTPDQKIASRSLIELYSINSTDAYILQCALDEADKLRTVGDDIVFVSSDKRPLAVAQKEGLLTFDPETGNQTYLDVFINSP